MMSFAHTRMTLAFLAAVSTSWIVPLESRAQTTSAPQQKPADPVPDDAGPVVDNGTIKALNVEPSGEYGISSAEALLASL